MQSVTVGNSTAPPQVFAGAIDGRNCHPDNDACEVEPKLIINVYLRGGQRFILDGRQFAGCATHDGRCHPQVLMINVRQPSKLYFNNQDGNSRLHKVKASASLSWLEQEIGTSDERPPVLERFLSTHLSHFAFEPTPDFIEVAEQISHPPSNIKGEMLALYRKARAIEMVRLACAALVASADKTDNRPSLLSSRQADRARSYILENLTSPLTIGTIAKESGASVSSVQRYFKHQFGMTVFEYIRRKRLEAAREALEIRGVTVAEAAWVAGYVSPSSFIAAFKKLFGTCPGDIRA